MGGLHVRNGVKKKTITPVIYWDDAYWDVDMKLN